MFSSFVNRSGPALLIAIGFLLISVGSVGWAQSGKDYERMQSIAAERLFTQSLIEEYGSRAALRIGEDMTTSERTRHREAARQHVMNDESNPIHATFKSERRRALVQIFVGVLLTLFAGGGYIRTFRNKGILPE